MVRGALTIAASRKPSLRRLALAGEKTPTTTGKTDPLASVPLLPEFRTEKFEGRMLIELPPQ